MDFIFDPSLVLYLPLEQLDGSSFTSKDAYGHLCSVTGAVWRHNGRYFDGTDDRIACGNKALFSLTRYTIIAWLKPNITDDHQIIVDRYDGGEGGWSLSVETNGYIRNSSVSGGGSNNFDDTVSITDGSWHFAAAVYDGVQKRIHRDSIVLSTPHTDDPDPVVAYGLEIGRRAELGNNFMFDGLIGEVIVYSRGYSPLEVEHVRLATKWRYR